MELRDAEESDLDEIGALIRELADYERSPDSVTWTRNELREGLFGADAVPQVLLAVDGDAVIGFALWFPTFSTWVGKPGIWLEDLFVRPDRRGKGAGAALIHALRARTDGRVEWNVLDWNTPAIGFYDSLGASPNAGWTTYRWDPR
ncbi:MAG TPA: GNAT family N-acetyltransferase [Acidimicrobiales bacterium]